MVRSRRFSLVVALVLVVGLLAVACGDDDVGAGGSDLDTVTLQLDWVPNTNHTGFFVADELGYYAQEGIELEILPYSGGNGDTLVAEGVADFAVSFHNSLTLARPAGVPIKAVAAVVQHATDAIAVKADRDDIVTPADLDGLLYAGFGSPFEVPVMTAVIQAAGGEGVFDSVFLSTAAYEAVYNGSADFVIPFKPWEGIEAELKDEPLKYFDYEDYGVPDQYSVIVVAADGFLAQNGDLAERFLRATRRGFEFGVENPTEAAQILIDTNPGVFNLEELVFRSQELMADEYFVDDEGRWGTIDPDRFAGYSGFLYEAGIITGEDGRPLTAQPDWSEFVDPGHLS
jgi:ABC-type nitrate/sulfonate/bicarbonate transport system substrate-binding protein